MESDERLGRGTVRIPAPSSAVETGFDDPAHRARVSDALCFGEPAVWGAVEQAVSESIRSGDTFADVTDRYTRLVGACDLPAHCAWARKRYPNSDGEIQGFWLHVLATCGDLEDRVLFRDLDAEPRAVATYYTAEPLPPHRMGADDGALLLATERLIARGGNKQLVEDAAWSLLAHENPEAAESLVGLLDSANLDVKDVLKKALSGQTIACEAHPELCGNPRPERPTEELRWMAQLGATRDPDAVTALVDEHPDYRDKALPALEECGDPCTPQHTLVSGDTAVSDELDGLGVTWREDRAGRSAFGDSLASGLHGRGRLVRIDPSAEPDNEHLLRHLLRIAGADPAEVFGSDVIDSDGTRRAAIETIEHRWQIAVDGVDLDACVTLTNHALSELGTGLQLVELEAQGAMRAVAAVPTEAVAALSPPE